MAKLNLPETEIKLKTEKKSLYIFDPVRKKWLLLTPEEWVRQHLIMYFHEQLHFPLSLMETEKQFKLFNTTKRADIVLNDARLQPLVIVECKAPGITISDDVMDQAVRYNMALKAPFLFISNGIRHIAIKINGGKPVFLDRMPDYNHLTRDIK